MLGYRHGFHAGNFADVLKHLVLVNTLEYVIQKPTPLLYIDTHAGAGLYPLRGEMAQRTGEAEAGILSLDFKRLARQIPVEFNSPLATFERVIAPFLARQQYPGSPVIAASLLRQQDRLALFELHSTDFALMEDFFSKDRRVLCKHGDGFHSAKSLLPAAQNRAVVLIDPSYEIKTDYQKVVDYISMAYKRMPRAHYLVWYPVVQRPAIELMAGKIAQAGIPDLWRFELGIAPDHNDHGMTACGILAINPPWTLPQQLQQVLPAVQSQLSKKTGHWKVECLVPE